MFQELFTSYTGASASIEIFTMLLGAFTLWVVFGWLMKPAKSIIEVNKISAAKETAELKKYEEDVLSKDDLQLIEWIGPSLEKVLHKYGVQSYKDIVDEDVVGLEEILTQAGARYTMHNPATWPDQAKLAMQKKWTELEEYQEILNNGKKEAKKKK